MALQEQSLVDIAMPGQYMNGEEPSQEGIVFLEGISANVHVSIVVLNLWLHAYVISTLPCRSASQSECACSHPALQHSMLHHVNSPDRMCAVLSQWFCMTERQQWVWMLMCVLLVQVVRRHCSSYRRLGFIGTDGRTRHFIVQTGQHWHGSTGRLPCTHHMSAYRPPSLLSTQHTTRFPYTQHAASVPCLVCRQHLHYVVHNEAVSQCHACRHWA